MKNYIYNSLKLILALGLLVTLNSCSDDDTSSFVFENVSAPSNLNALIEMTNPDTNEISVTLSGENASTFEVFFGDVENEAPTAANPGETLVKQYPEEGEYILRAIAKSITGSTSELSRSIIIEDGEMVVDPIDDSMETAPIPAVDEANVISVFSDAYTNVSVDTFRTDWSAAILEETTINDDTVLKYSELNFLGIETVANQVDASAMTHIHIDVWTEDAESFGIKLVDFGADGAFDGGDDSEHQIDFENIVLSEWNSFDIAITDFAGLLSTKNIAQYILVATPSGAATIYVDNIYFYSDNMAAQLPQLPLDHELSTVSYAWGGFGNATPTIVGNPDVSGINTSSTVLQIEKASGAEVWAGSALLLNEAIDFSNSSVISVNVWSPRAGVPILFKIEDADSEIVNGIPGIFAELAVETTIANSWETLIFDMSIVEGFDITQMYDNVVVFPDFGNNGQGEIFYFDDIQFDGDIINTEVLELPIDHESLILSYTWGGFGNATPMVVDNPDVSGINTSSTVLQIDKASGAEVWAGSAILLNDAIDFSNSSVISVNVWSPRVGVPVLFKVEDADSEIVNGIPGIFAELAIETTVANSWETLLFDMSTVEGFDTSQMYDNVVIFPDFGSSGLGETYYFDDVSLN